MAQPPLFELSSRGGRGRRRPPRGHLARWLTSLGLHPVSMTVRDSIELHADAARTDFPKVGPTCGTCAFGASLESMPSSPRWAKNQFKCWRWPAKVTRGSGSDIRKGWPACLHYQERDK